MKTSLILLALVGFAACSTPWQVNQQYDYAFSANTLTGYGHGQDQYVGIITKGKLTLQPESESVVRGKLWQVRHAHFHDELKDGLNSEIPEEMLNFSDQPSSESLFSINYKNGVIRSLDVDPSLSNDDVNQLKAVLSQLQVDTTGENVIKCRHNQLPGDMKDASNALYKTMEATLVGQCETLYEMSAVPSFIEAEPSEQWTPQTELKLDENLFQFVKTVNFSNCDVVRGYHSGISGASDMKPNSNQMGDFLSKSAVSRILVASHQDRFTIKSADTTNRVAVSTQLHDNEQAEVVSRIGLVLESIEAAKTPLPVKADNWMHVGNLVYRYNIPSDKQNQARTSVKDAPIAGSSSSSSSSSSEEENQKQRNRRSLDSANKITKQNDAASSSSSSSESSEEYNSPQYAAKYPHHYQPHPQMNDATEQPLHPFTVGNRGSSIQYLENFDTVAEAQKMADEIAADLQVQGEIPSRNTLEKYTILSELIQTADYKQIQQILNAAQGARSQDNEQWGQQLAYETLLDATAQAGSNPAALWFVNAVSEGQIAGGDAASYLETVFENLRTPTEPLIRAIFEKIIKNDKIRNQNAQYPKILLTFTDLLRRAYSDKDAAFNYFPVQSFGSFEKGLGDIVAKEIIPYLGQNLKQSINNKNQKRSQLYIRALGNIADPQIVEMFEQYLENEQSATPFERLAMVAAFDRLVETFPKFAQKILYKLYANVAERPDIRSMAVTRFMLADPPAAMLQKMAMSTYNDPSIAVRTTVKSAINSAAQLTSSDNANLAANAKAAQQFLNPHTYGLQHSKTALRDHVSEILNLSEEYQMTHIIGPDSTFPKVLSYSSWKSHGGIDENEVDIQALVSSVEDVWDALLEDKENHGSWSINNMKSKYTMGKIIKQLGINFNSDAAREEGISGQLLWKLADRTNFISFDEKTLKSAPKHIASLAQDLLNGQQIQYNKMYDHNQIVVAFPLATGYPFYFAYKTPILMQVVGELKARTTPSLGNARSWANVLNTQAINATAKFNLTLSTVKIGKAGFITPFERQRYVAGQIRKMQVHLPLSVNLNVDIKNTAVSGKIAPLGSEDKIELAHFSSWPFTARKSALSMRPVAEAKEVKLVNVRPMVAQEEMIGEQTIGMGFHYRMQHQFSQSAVNSMEEFLQKEGLKQYARLPMNLITTLHRLVNQRTPFSPAEFLPFAFEPVTQTTQTGNVLLSLITAPFYQDLKSTGLVKLRAAMSLATMAFADASELKATTLEEDVSATGPWPQGEIAHYKFSLQLDLQRSANQALKFGVQFDNEQEINDSAYAKRSDKPVSASEEHKLAVVTDIAPNSGARREEMMANAARDMKQASGGLIDVGIVFDGAKPAKFVFTVAQAVNSVEDKARVLVFKSDKFASATPGKQIYASYVHNFANTPALSYERAQHHNGKSNARLTVLFGEAGKLTNTKINVKAVFQQSHDYSQQLRQTPIVKECVRQMQHEGNNQMQACLEATYNANLLNEIRIVADAENMTPELESWAHSALSVLNQWGYYQAQHDHSQTGAHDRVEAQVNIDPFQQTVNITLQLEGGVQNFTGLPIPRPARDLLSVHPGMDLTDRMMRTFTRNAEVCVIDQTKILTFDSAVVENQKFGNCWYAAVHHNNTKSPSEELTIMVRQAGNGQKEILIVAPGQSIQLSPSDGSKAPAKVIVNGKEQKVSDKVAIDVRSKDPQGGLLAKNILIARIYAISEQDLKVEFPESQMKMYYDGERIRVHAKPDLRNEVVGLCGNYNGEEIDDVASPQGKVFQNEAHFASSWAMPDEVCDAEVKQARQNALVAPSFWVQYQAGNVVSDFENGKQRQAKGQDNKNWKWESGSSSSSSESDEQGKNQNENQQLRANLNRKKQPCEVAKRVQFISVDDQTCFTKTEVNACPSHCAKAGVTKIEVPAHCRNKSDSVASMFVQQIRRGANPDLGSKPANRNIQVSVPESCVAK